jgi:hypothetical protein
MKKIESIYMMYFDNFSILERIAYRYGFDKDDIEDFIHSEIIHTGFNGKMINKEYLINRFKNRVLKEYKIKHSAFSLETYIIEDNIDHMKIFLLDSNNRLSNREQLVLYHNIYLNLSLKHISEIVEIPYSYVRILKYRGLRKLKKYCQSS